jgi:WXG100 family type VII secretion target
MGQIHVNTDLMRQLGQLFVSINEQINNQLEPQIAHAAAELDSDWVGVSYQHFNQVLIDWRSTVARLTSYGEELGQHLEHTAQMFEQADQSL